MVGFAGLRVPIASDGSDWLSKIWWRMIFSENRLPPPIKAGAGFFRIML
jgi:hypothetical protein